MFDKISKELKKYEEELNLITQEINKHKSMIQELMAHGNATIGKIDVLKELLTNKEDNKNE